MNIIKTLNHKVEREKPKKKKLFESKEDYLYEYYARHIEYYYKQELLELQQEYKDLLEKYEKQADRFYKERQDFADIMANDMERELKVDAYDKIVRIAESNNLGDAENQIARIKSYISQEKSRQKNRDCR